MLIQIKNGNPIGYAVLESNFRQLFPRTSFPQFLGVSDVESFGFGMYEFTPQPTPGKYEKVAEVSAVKDKQGIWRQTWAVVSMDDAEKSIKDSQQTFSIRTERNKKLSTSDWTQGKDIADEVSTAWVTYRQALRDVPAQTGFPWNVIWPKPPNL